MVGATTGASISSVVTTGPLSTAAAPASGIPPTQSASSSTNGGAQSGTWIAVAAALGVCFFLTIALVVAVRRRSLQNHPSSSTAMEVSESVSVGMSDYRSVTELSGRSTIGQGEYHNRSGVSPEEYHSFGSFGESPASDGEYHNL
jgi:hypothetical protein